MKISCTFCQHLGAQILSLLNRKINQVGGGEKIVCSLFKMDFLAFKKFVSYII